MNRFVLFGAIFLSLATAPLARAADADPPGPKSIFDDNARDYTSGGNHTRSKAPIPTGNGGEHSTAAPDSAPPVVPSQETPGPAEKSATPEPAPEAPPIVADEKIQKQQAEEKQQAEILANLAAAKAKAEQAALANPEYAKTLAAVETARKAYQAARAAGDPDATAAAFADVSKANLNKENAYKQIVDADQGYQKAKALAAPFAGKTSPGVNATVVKTPEVSEEIAYAIEHRTLCLGMNFQQARKASRKPFALVEHSGDSKTYRWYIKGRTGTFTVVSTRDRYGRIHTESTPDFGVTAYVEGTFVDDKLISFGRYSVRPNGSVVAPRKGGMAPTNSGG